MKETLLKGRLTGLQEFPCFVRYSNNKTILVIILYPLSLEPPEGHFRVEYMERRSCLYSSKFTFRIGLQEETVCYKLYDDPDRMYEAQESLISSPASHYPLFHENPLQLGFFLYSIGTGAVVYVTMLKCYNPKYFHRQRRGVHIH